MAGNPNARKLRELLTEKADWLLKKIATGQPMAELAKELGVYPAQIDKFMVVMDEYRERYRAALQSAKDMNEKTQAKVKKTKGMKTQAEICELFEAEILDALADGKLIREVAAGLQISYPVISRYFNANEGRKTRYDAALTEGSHSMAEQSVAVTDGIAFNLVEAKMVELRASRLAWLASKRNPQYDQRIAIKGEMAHAISIDIKA